MKTVFVALFAGIVGSASVQPVSAADAVIWKEKVLHSFDGADGSAPAASLIDVNGTLYGTTENGGSAGLGTVFSLNPGTGAETVLHSFAGGTDGEHPSAGLLAVKGILYGTTSGGGGRACRRYEGCGTVFSLDPGTGMETVLHSFGGRNDGQFPTAGLIDVNGTLYGTTDEGRRGLEGHFGTVFSLDPGTGTETVLYAFNGVTGEYPSGSLTAANGILYGTTFFGDAYGYYGTVFSLDPGTGAETTLYSFCPKGNPCTDGSEPLGGVIAVNGTLYGTTSLGGGTGCYSGGGCGVVFSLDPSTGTETVLHVFGGGTDGQYPVGGLINVNGTLYGTASDYYRYAGCGTAFSLDPGTGAETVLHCFPPEGSSDGVIPMAGLLSVKDTLYGTTLLGGASQAGTVFVLKQKP